MIPRFCNPHALGLAEKKATRSELYHDSDGASTEVDHSLLVDERSSLEETLKRRIHEILDIDVVGLSSGRKKKRRKVAQDFFSDDEGGAVLDEKNAVLFRLLSSSSEPRVISLDPLPPPPSRFREPEYEDTSEAAEQRRARAQQVAVDAQWVKEHASVAYMDLVSRGGVEEIKNTSTSTLFPEILLLERLQCPRSTRPPVVDAHKRYPYARDVTAIDDSPSVVRVPVLKIDPQEKKKRKRIRGKNRQTDRPQPKFWVPDSAWNEKCRGYAFGYPSSLNAYYVRGDESKKSSWRDTMKKAIVLDTFPET